jgi:hypothetical protein
MAIVYKHIRNDTNKVFYIGIGKTEKRAYQIKNRNQYWKNIVNRFGYTIEFVETNLSWLEACQMEIKLIKQYGRNDLNEGGLVNMTDGGDGVNGMIYTEERNTKISNTLIKTHIARGKTFSELYGDIKSKSIKNKISKNNAKHWMGKIRSEQHCKKLSINHADVSGSKNPRAVKILQYNKDNQFIKEWDYIKEAAESINNHSSNIIKCCNGIGKSCGGYIWKYKTK